MMIHKIEPHKYYPEFRSQDPKPSDYLLLFDGEKVYLPSHTENSDVTDTSAGAGISEHPQVYLPTFEEVHGLLGIRQPMERFFLDCEYLFPLMTEHSSARRRRTPVLSCSRKKTSTLPVCSVILSRNIWHLLESLPPRSIVSVWTGNSVAARASHSSQHYGTGLHLSGVRSRSNIPRLSRRHYRHRGYRAGQDPADPLRRRFLSSLGTGGRLRGSR